MQFLVQHQRTRTNWFRPQEIISAPQRVLCVSSDPMTSTLCLCDVTIICGDHLQQVFQLLVPVNQLHRGRSLLGIHVSLVLGSI